GMPGSGIPELDGELRRRLGRRFGDPIGLWLDRLPAVLEDLARRWEIEWGALIQRGSMSVVIHCRTADGRAAVVKLSPALERVAQLFEPSRKLYELKPDLAELVSPELYERSRELAMRLAADAAPNRLLHGDLTPVNVLDGGTERGLVAIDPAPCMGDPAFDAIDLVLWRAEDVETIAGRAEQLAPAIGAGVGRLLDWCAAFAGMVALEI